MFLIEHAFSAFFSPHRASDVETGQTGGQSGICEAGSRDCPWWAGRRLCFRSLGTEVGAHGTPWVRQNRGESFCECCFFSTSAVAQSTGHGSAGTAPRRDSPRPAKPTPSVL